MLKKNAKIPLYLWLTDLSVKLGDRIFSVHPNKPTTIKRLHETIKGAFPEPFYCEKYILYIALYTQYSVNGL